MQERDFKGVWIPKDIWLSKELSLVEKALLVEIDSLDNEEHCFASNEYFAEFLGVSESTVVRAIKKLKEQGYIEEVGFDGRTRKLRVVNLTRQNIQNDYHNNIDNKVISNDINDITNVISSAEPNNVDDFFKTQSLIEKPKKKKSTLYANCMSLIDDFTQDEEVRNLLKDYFKVRLERKDIPLGKASFQGSLNKLRTLTTSKKEVLQIIQQSIDRCYPSFYPLSKPRYTKEYTCPEIISKGEKREITQEEYEEAMLNGEKF